MANRSRAKGTAWEVELLEILRPVFPHIERAPLRGAHDSGDFVNVPWLHEAKNTKVPRFLDWVRNCRNKQSRWAILWKGDRRSVDGQPLAVIPLELYLELLEHRNCHQTQQGPGEVHG